MINWFKKLLWVVRNFEAVKLTADKAQAQAKQAQAQADGVVSLVHDRTTVHFDISPTKHDPNVVILVGSYQGKDFVQVYSFRADEFSGLVNQMREAVRHGAIGRVDAPPTLRAVIDRDFKL
jgi:hypothetical protein